MSARSASARAIVPAALTLAILCAAPFGLQSASASDDATRNKFARNDCVRGKFKDYYRQGEGGDPPAGYTGRVFKLSQDFPNKLPPMEKYPWLKVPFKNGGPVNPEAYLQALLQYGLEGNVDVDFYVEDNKTRKWFHMPWMDWNTEVASDWPGTDGREFVHGFTHEFDSSGNTLSTLQKDFVDTWSGGYMNDRAAFSVGQVYCNPDDPKPNAINPDPNGLNNMANGAYVIKLLFSTVTEQQLPIVKGAVEWKVHGFVNENPKWRNEGPISRYDRAIKTVRLIQIDVSVRDDRSTTGWLMGTFGYDGTGKGKTAWQRMVPLGLQWGNNPRVPYAETCKGPNGPCDRKKLTEQWINEKAAKTLATPPLSFNHLGYAGRLAGPVDNPKASCLGCHQTAGFPLVAILPEFSANGTLLKLDAERSPQTEQSFRMMYYGNVASGAVFSDTQLYSGDYSLQLAMSIQNFISRRCQPGATPAGQQQPSICGQLSQWVAAQRKAIKDLMTFGAPGQGGAPIATEPEK